MYKALRKRNLKCGKVNSFPSKEQQFFSMIPLFPDTSHEVWRSYHPAENVLKRVNSWEIIVYSQSTINAYSLLSHEWWVPLIKFMIGIHHLCEGVCIYDILRVPNNFSKFFCFIILLGENS